MRDIAEVEDVSGLKLLVQTLQGLGTIHQAIDSLVYCVTLVSTKAIISTPDALRCCTAMQGIWLYSLSMMTHAWLNSVFLRNEFGIEIQEAIDLSGLSFEEDAGQARRQQEQNYFR
ncbi:hypothetical protein TNCV_800161 [Trichonephila clavipes]|nr:hypothetical protein TNCV_800161 [Trichonephila clavipes]